MQSLVIFGAGNIGRGFIAPLLSASGYRVQFVDVDNQRITAINQRGHYYVHEVFNQECRTVEVAPIQGIDAQDAERVGVAIAGADILACAVGLHVLPRIAPAIADGLKRRWQQGGGALDILVCENGIDAAQILRDAVMLHVGRSLEKQCDALFGAVRTSIGRMIPANTDEKSLDIAVEPYCHLPCDGAAFRAAQPRIPELECTDDFDLHIHKKLYLHNCTHACLAYIGAQRNYQTIPECAADTEIMATVTGCAQEIIEALVMEHGESCRQSCGDMLDDLLYRYTNTALKDTVSRVCRDPARKLAAGDRLLGAAALCLHHNIPSPYLYTCIYAACQYQIDDGEEYCEQWRKWQQQGAMHVVQQASGLPSDDTLLRNMYCTFKEFI